MQTILATFSIADEAGMAAIARRLSPVWRRGDVICLSGPLGAGKTSFARATIADRLGIKGDIPSPTFSLVQHYEPTDSTGTPIWHFDLYRLDREEEIWELGFEMAEEDAISLVEWAEKADNLMPAASLGILITPTGPTTRDLTLRCHTTYADSWAQRLAVVRTATGKANG